LKIEGKIGDLSDMTGRMPVPQLRLDDIPSVQNARLIKIDVEGMEESVITGANNLIARNRPTLYVENEYPGERSESLIDAILALNYKIYWDIAPLFTENNFSRNKENIFGRIICINMLCVPADKDFTITNFRQLKNAKEHPRGNS